jgi:hypothetical protein
MLRHIRDDDDNNNDSPTMLRQPLTNTESLLAEVVFDDELTDQTDRNQLHAHNDHCDAEQK